MPANTLPKKAKTSRPAHSKAEAGMGSELDGGPPSGDPDGDDVIESKPKRFKSRKSELDYSEIPDRRAKHQKKIGAKAATNEPSRDKSTATRKRGM